MTKPVLIVSVLIIVAHLGAQSPPQNVKPMIAIGAEYRVQKFKSPLISNGQLVNAGQLTAQQLVSHVAGSGSVITKDGLILTNWHVISGSSGSIEYDQEKNELFVMQRTSQDFIIWELDENDPLVPPVKKYTAEVIAMDETADIALLKLKIEINSGQPVSGELDYLRIDNPFRMKLNDRLTVVGYPAAGGLMPTISYGRFLGYFKGSEQFGKDGVIKTDAPMSPGNSGGSALYKNKLIGVPTAVTSPSYPGFFGYIHPITWAARAFIIAETWYGLHPPAIETNWLQSRYNYQFETLPHYFSGNVFFAQSLMPVAGASLMVHRLDFSRDKIVALFNEMQPIIEMIRKQVLLQNSIIW